MKKKITMQDIAKIANVSRMTVSRYFSGGYVSLENKAKIKMIIDEYDYIPNVYAQSLKKKLDVIGVILPTIISRTSTKLLKGIIDEADKRNYDYLITTAENNEERELKALQNFQNLNVRGVIALTVNPQMYVERKKQFTDLDIVLISQVPVSMPAIIYPDQQAVANVIEELIAPHLDKIKRVCLLTDGTIFRTRESFIKENLQTLLPKLPFYEIITPHSEESLINFSPEVGTFCICITDQIAYNLYETIRQTKLTIGKDIYVIGFGDYSTSKSQMPPLSSVSFPYYQAGVAATNKLLLGKDNPEKTKNEYMNFTIMKRKSTL